VKVNIRELPTLKKGHTKINAGEERKEKAKKDYFIYSV
jgi:hypothetical protein